MFRKISRVEGDMDGHWWQWIDACIAGYGNAEVDSPLPGMPALLPKQCSWATFFSDALISGKKSREQILFMA